MKIHPRYINSALTITTRVLLEDLSDRFVIAALRRRGKRANMYYLYDSVTDKSCLRILLDSDVDESDNPLELHRNVIEEMVEEMQEWLKS